MQSAKESVKKFISKDGKHDTTVHENVAPHVQHENVSQTQHEKVTQAVDREVHQDHYHTTEQPIHHAEVLPEQHHHNAAQVEHRSFEHDNADEAKSKLAAEQARYQHSTTRVEGEKTRSMEPTIAGEHVHHHVHETVQPVVHKETVEPHVVHTTVPVHEVHHNASQHHSASALPAVSMDDFKKQGGSLGGREERKDFFPGEPQSFTGGSSHGTSGLSSEHHGTSGLSSGHTGTTGTSGLSSGHTGNTGTFGHQSETDRASGLGSTDNYSSTGTKPSMMDKIDPRKDATGDGQSGFMK